VSPGDQARYEAVARLLDAHAAEVVRSGEDADYVQEIEEQAAWLRSRVKEARDAK